MKDGKPTGEYEDFMIGFVVNNAQVVGPSGGGRNGEGWGAAGE
jgi:hypothetical protein